MADVACFEMPVEAGLELGAIIRLDVAYQSSGNSATQLASDLGLLVAALAGQSIGFDSAAWIMTPALAAKLAAVVGSGGAPAFPAITVKGGMLLGIPVLCSNSVSSSISAGTIVVLVEASALDVADDG